MIAPAAGVPCRTLAGYHELPALRASWQALCDRCPACTPFQRPDWLLPWVQHLGPTEPWIFTVHSDEHLLALVPLSRYQREQDGGAGDAAASRACSRSRTCARSMPKVAEAFAARDALALYGLWLDDRLIACLYGFCEARTQCFYISGFDPAAAHLSPGTLIVGMVLEDAIEHGMTQFDFLRGSEPYKYWWGATDHENVRISLRWSGVDARPGSSRQLTPARAGAGTARDSATS